MRRRLAFTLIELMVVISIIALLAAALGVGIRNAQINSRDSRRLSDVLSISKAIDQYALTNRGNYPVNVTATGSVSTMCANELLDVNNTNGLDLSFLPSRTMPTDPRAVTPKTSGCTNYLNGYTYHTEFGHPASAASGNLAAQKYATYAIEVGLEDSAPSDQTTLKAGTSGSNRNQYILYGPSCGTPAANTCYK